MQEVRLTWSEDECSGVVTDGEDPAGYLAVREGQLVTTRLWCRHRNSPAVLREAVQFSVKEEQLNCDLRRWQQN